MVGTEDFCLGHGEWKIGPKHTMETSARQVIAAFSPKLPGPGEEGRSSRSSDDRLVGALPSGGEMFFVTILPLQRAYSVFLSSSFFRTLAFSHSHRATEDMETLKPT